MKRERGRRCECGAHELSRHHPIHRSGAETHTVAVCGYNEPLPVEHARMLKNLLKQFVSKFLYGFLAALAAQLPTILHDPTGTAITAGITGAAAGTLGGLKRLVTYSDHKATRDGA